MYELNQVDGNSINISNLDQELLDHFFDNDKNHALTIMKQINEDCFYNRFFKDKKDLIVLDIGANIGLFSLHVFPACKKIIAFEPTPSHYEKLKKITQNTIIETRQLALFSKNGQIIFNINPFNSTMNSIVNNGCVENITVPCVNLEEIIQVENLDCVDFCKIDIEGSEMVALTNESLSPISGKIKHFFIEVHPTLHLDGMNQQQNKEKLWSVFQDLGYDLEDVNFETFTAKWSEK
jgi:FkbM family methyltransferase